MKKPLIFQYLPYWFQKRLYYRLYYPVEPRWYHLFKNAPLKYAKKCKMQLLPTDFMHGEIAFTGVYEQQLSAVIAKKGINGGLMIDVGANAGYFSLIWASANKSNKVIAFEAAEKNAQILSNNIEENKLDNRIEVHSIALGSETGQMDFDPGPDDVTGWGGIALEGGSNTYKVPVMRLDELIAPDIEISLLKIDVEGADTWVLMGAENLLRRKQIKEIYYEQNKPRLNKLNIQINAANEFLEKVGYCTLPIDTSSKDVVEWKAYPL